MIIAHKDEFGNEQLLYDHLINVARSSYRLGSEVGLKYSALLVGILHDLGKADPLFQDMIINNTKASVIHSSAGAKYINNLFISLSSKHDEFKRPICICYKEILMYVIEAHHGVFDICSYDFGIRNDLYRRIDYDLVNKNYNYNLVEKFAVSVDTFCIKEYEKSLEDICILGFEEYKEIIENLSIKESKDPLVELYFYNHCIMRLLLSILKNEDIYDSVNAFEAIIDRNSKIDRRIIINDYYQKIEDEYASYPEPTNEINKVRLVISKNIRSRCDTDSNGVYKLDLPTGAGKTKLSLLYSLHQMKNNKKNKMIYIAPFLSILEQNASEYRKTLENDKYILEHHSNLVDNTSFDNEGNDINNVSAMKEYIKDSWDQIIILSTMVQFTNTLFKSKASNLRRFYNLSNSVIILDEIQSLPHELTHVFNLMVNFISKVMNSVIILTSATQPSLDHDSIRHKIIYGGASGENYDLIKLDDRQKQIFDRVDVSLINGGKESKLTDIYTSVLSDNQKSTLIILNTKKSVMNLYKMLDQAMEDTSNLYYLTTNMCPRHRLDIINEIKDKLSNNINVIVISTSLIEAGVNLDFRRLYRSYAGFDSIIQAMGRCNREGRYPKGEVYLVNLSSEDENLRSLRSIEFKKEVSNKVLDKFDGDFDIDILNKKYYDKLFSNSDDLDYILKDNKSLLDLLSLNSRFREGASIKGKNIQALKEASEKFNLIEDLSESVIIYYGDSYNLIEELLSEIEAFRRHEKNNIKQIKDLINKLQVFTINLYNTKDIDQKLVKKEGLEYFDIKILNESNYDEKIGLTEESKLESFMLWLHWLRNSNILLKFDINFIKLYYLSIVL